MSTRTLELRPRSPGKPRLRPFSARADNPARLVRFLTAAACFRLTLLCRVACCGLMEDIQSWLDRLGAL